MYAEKARYDPHSNPVWGLSSPPPTSLSKVGKYGIELKWN